MHDEETAVISLGPLDNRITVLSPSSSLMSHYHQRVRNFIAAAFSYLENGWRPGLRSLNWKGHRSAHATGSKRWASKSNFIYFISS